MDINYFYLLGIVLLLLWIIISARQMSIKQRCYKLKRKIAELLLEEGLDIVHLAQKLGPRPPAYLADILEEMEYNDHLLKTEKSGKTPTLRLTETGVAWIQPSKKPAKPEETPTFDAKLFQKKR